MIVAVHQPNYLPYLGFFHKMHLADTFVLYDTAQFSKNDFHNRNRIKTPRGLKWLTIPVRRPTGLEIRAVEADMSKPWARNHWEAIRANYARAEHFEEHRQDLDRLYGDPGRRLAEINRPFIDFLSQTLGIERRIVWASNLHIPEGLSASEKLAAMVREVGGDAYLSGPDGAKYVERNAFVGLAVYIQEFRHPRHRQLWRDFASNASALDLVLNLGEEAASLLPECGAVRPFPRTGTTA
jgi:hypothetical protein